LSKTQQQQTARVQSVFSDMKCQNCQKSVNRQLSKIR